MQDFLKDRQAMTCAEEEKQCRWQRDPYPTTNAGNLYDTDGTAPWCSQREKEGFKRQDKQEQEMGTRSNKYYKKDRSEV